MKIISCASYYGSGSSAITDLVSEYNNVFSFTSEEFRFIQDPDGISDLEYNLVENFNRHNSGHSIKRYLRLVNYYNGNFLGKKYRNFFGDKWKIKSMEYIETLTDFTYKGWWTYDLIDKGPLFYFRKRILNKILKMTIWRSQPERTLNTMKSEITYCSHPSEEKFITATKKYIRDLFGEVSKGYSFIAVDQIVPPTNLKRYIRYFDDIKIIIVDRDPRDIFILEKYFWKDGIIPTDVIDFCKWFKYTRNNRNLEVDNKNVFFVKFEDIIYNYETTVLQIEKWLDLESSNHVNKFKYLNPNISKNNTKLWEKIKLDLDEIRYIETELSEYLYEFI